MKRFALSCAALFTSAAACQAQTANEKIVDAALSRLAGTMSVSYSPTFSGGSLSGCGIEFNALVRNFAVRSGAYEKVTGSFGFMMANRTIAPVLKVVVHEIDRATMALSPAPPKRGYVVAGAKSNFASLHASYPSDTPGALFSIFKIEPTTSMYFEALAEGKLTIRYGRTPSGVDVPLALDLSVIETKDDGQRVKSAAPVNDMLSCMSSLLEAVQ
ncbi:MAG TPA: hypothetical protein VGO06_28480 [Bosea sp. (in: a-proteobacteria)]|uniref:hypothetical protein n=1 Tax=Bosea sp. (in: a-proteobacteria) TaxID=1871050 RepID=UPI002E12A5F7|nr:hypothetical protein [Bosea sp. (in: a-proteobacteria)]